MTEQLETGFTINDYEGSQAWIKQATPSELIEEVKVNLDFIHQCLVCFNHYRNDRSDIDEDYYDSYGLCVRLLTEIDRRKHAIYSDKDPELARPLHSK